MKYLLTIVILLLACSNPADVQEPDPTEYSIRYDYYTADSLGGVMVYMDYFNPETGIVGSTAGNGFAGGTLEMTAHSNQTLWTIVTSTVDITAYIYVDGEIVATSATADSVYTEYLLP